MQGERSSDNAADALGPADEAAAAGIEQRRAQSRRLEDKQGRTRIQFAKIDGLVRTRSFGLNVLLLIVVMYTLYIGRAFFLPIVLAILLSFVFAPTMRWLRRIHVPDAIGAGLIVATLLGVVGVGIYNLADPAQEWLAKAPDIMRQLEGKIRVIKKPVEEVSEATKRVEEMANVGQSNVRTVQVQQEPLATTILSETGEFLFGAISTFILLLFLLASGNLFLQKIVRVLPRLDDKKRAVEVAREMEREISTYLFTIALINTGLGAVTAVAMYLLGMPNPILWGVMVALLNFIPYVGDIVSIIVLAVVALLTFDNLGHALLVPFVYYVITALEGQLITPMILGRRFTLNPVVIFISLMFWGWIWGIPGALLAVPFLVSFKILCDHVEPLSKFGEFLGR